VPELTEGGSAEAVI